MAVLRFSTAPLPARDRAALFQDEVARRFINAEMAVNPAHGRTFYFDSAMTAGAVMRFAEVDFAAVDVDRSARDVRDGDDGVTCFLPTGAPVRTLHGDRRGVIRSGGAVLIGHGRPGASFWPDNHVTLLMFPRAAFFDPGAIDAAGGLVHAPNRPLLRLLRAYLRSVWAEAEAGAPITPAVERVVIDIISSLAAHTVEGMRRAAWPALGPARLAAMREVIARRAAEPGLSMREVAAAVGIGERSGHLVFAAAGLVFSDCLAEARLQRVHRRLATGLPGRIIDIAFDCGFGDVAHFNRLFRRLYDTTPGEVLRGAMR
ncbi:MAG: AraC family transcriptional regulator [Acetobacteraceae bacterium]|nr:AraC family transcriptional regulator [Acetobacteraceae bacterium]